MLSLIFLLTLYINGFIAAPSYQRPHTNDEENENSSRQGKNIGFFDYIQPEIDFESYATDDDYNSVVEENDLSRTVPSKKHRRPQYNSPIYYIRLPPQPYMFVPGLGYVSQPAPNPMSQFVNLPVNFVSNGKPSGIYQWTGGIEIPPVPAPHRPAPPKPKPVKKPLKPIKPDSTIHRLPGQFFFNGKPDDIFVLRDSYNSLYSDMLQNLYP